ncbi:unnamed protein product [Ascophyllum nodosum]
MKAHAFFIILAAFLACAWSFVVYPQGSSALTLSSPRSRLSDAATAAASPRARRGVSGISMKRKGKQNSNIQQRGSYNQMLQQELQYKEQQKAMDTGMPAFQLYARTKVNNMWYPCGTMMGDNNAKATVDGMMGGFLSGVSKYSLEKSIASSVLAKKTDLIRQVEQAYPQLVKKPLVFGYKVIYKGLEEKLGKQEVTEINKDMTLGPMDTIKKKMGW